MLFRFDNVNEAFRRFLKAFEEGGNFFARQESRNGPVVRFKDPVLMTFDQPQLRVLLNTARDCNPFFHLYEALWMLAGRRDIQPLCLYNSRMIDFSDDGKTQWGAYGSRWRYWFDQDQLRQVIDELTKSPNSRRCVIGMWDPARDFQVAQQGGKDVPCNTHIYVEIQEGKLNMTVCNRSNDLVWGLMGANIVHMTFLQEYLAGCVGVNLGSYHVMTNNLHVYQNEFYKPKEWLDWTYEGDDWEELFNLTPLWQVGETVESFDTQNRFLVELFSIDRPSYGTSDTGNQSLAEFYDMNCVQLKNNFLRNVAAPAFVAFHLHKRRDYSKALKACERIAAYDWKYVCTKWIEKRKAMYDARKP